MTSNSYSAQERRVMIAFATIGFVVINGVFLYATLSDPALLPAALSNPVSAAFIAEALLLVVFLGYFLRKWKVTSIPLWLFIFLSLIGSLAFSLPLAMLFGSRESTPPTTS